MFYKLFLAPLVVMFFNSNSYAQTDSLALLLEQSDGNDKISILHQLIMSHWLDEPQKALRYGHAALDLSRQLGDSVNISKSFRLIGGVYFYRGDINNDLVYNLKALDIAESLLDSSLINNCYNNIGLIYSYLGSYQISLEYLLRAKMIKEKTNETYGLSGTLSNLGLLYIKANDNELARKYLFEALKIAEQLSDHDDMILAQNTIGITYLKQQNYEIALNYFEKALKLAYQVNNTNWGAVALRGIGEIWLNNERYDSAHYYFTKALESSMSIDDQVGMAQVLYLYARLEYLEGNISAAFNHLGKSQMIANQMGDRHQFLANLQLFTTISKSTNDLKDVIRYQGNYIQLQDSLFQDATSRSLALTPIKLNEEENRIKIAKQKLELDKKQHTNKLYAIIIVLAIVFLASMFLLLQKIRKVNRLQKETLAKIAFVEAHELRGPISSLIGLIELIQITPEDAQGQKDYLEKIKWLAVKIDTVSRDIIHRSEKECV